MVDTATLALTSAALGQSLLVITVLLLKAKTNQVFTSLAYFLLVLNCLLIQPISQAFMPRLEVYSIIIMLPALLTLGPLLWRYVSLLTSTQDQYSINLNYKHGLLPLLGIAAAILTALLPKATLTELFFTHNPNMTLYVSILMVLVFLLVLSWLAQSTYYLIRITIHLQSYHASLKHYFADTDSRKMYWLYGFIGLLSIIWVLAIIAVFMLNLFDYKLISPSQAATQAIVVIWCLSFFGLLQRPGLEKEGHFNTKEVEVKPSTNKSKYQHSALDKVHSERIAGKLENLMLNQLVYLEPDISLSKLSEMTGISPNYISQTLNATLEQNFFDYINGWRIKHAQSLLVESSKSIVDIAFEVGFNARSSFYKAFKQFVQQTPSEYRQSNR